MKIYKTNTRDGCRLRISIPEECGYIMFFHPECVFSQMALPVFERVGADLSLKYDLGFYTVDCDKEPETAKLVGIEGYPSIFFVKHGVLEGGYDNNFNSISGIHHNNHHHFSYSHKHSHEFTKQFHNQPTAREIESQPLDNNTTTVNNTPTASSKFDTSRSSNNKKYIKDLTTFLYTTKHFPSGGARLLSRCEYMDPKNVAMRTQHPFNKIKIISMDGVLADTTTGIKCLLRKKYREMRNVPKKLIKFSAGHTLRYLFYEYSDPDNFIGLPDKKVLRVIEYYTRKYPYELYDLVPVMRSARKIWNNTETEKVILVKHIDFERRPNATYAKIEWIHTHFGKLAAQNAIMINNRCN